MATCFGCGTDVPDESGTYYCPTCVEAQLAEQGDELAAFDAYHAWADRVSIR